MSLKTQNPSPENTWRVTSRKTKNQLRPDRRLVKDLFELGYRKIVGIDEVGRGAIAGPIVVAAVELTIFHADITDSKQLSAKKRQSLALFIHQNATQLRFGTASNVEIDTLGIVAAQRLAYDRALERIDGDVFLTDFYDLPGRKYLRAIKGDQLFYPTAAASIAAKVYRDQLMCIYHQFLPKYNWCSNVGYGTLNHRKNIEENGPSPLHRLTFRSS